MFSYSVLTPSSRVNLNACNRRAATHKTRRSIKKEWQAAWLLRAVTCIDLTTLAGDDTKSNVSRLCHKAKSPVQTDIIKVHSTSWSNNVTISQALGVESKNIKTGAVCVYPSRVAEAVKLLEGTGIPVASVAAGRSRHCQVLLLMNYVKVSLLARHHSASA